MVTTGRRAARSSGTGRRRRGLAAAALVLGGLASAALLRPADPAASAEVAVVGRGTVEDTVTALGKIQPRAYVDVGAQVSGQLTRLHVTVGQMVRAGDLLAEIDPALQQAKVEAGRAERARLTALLAEQRARAAFAEAQLARQASLRNSGSGRGEAYDQASMEARIAAAQVEATQAQIRQTDSTLQADEAQLGYTRIYAPMSGTLIAVDARQGQTINSTYEAPVLMRIADLSAMTVWTQVSEADVTRLTDGMPLYFTTLGHPGRRWTARLQQILPAPLKPATSGTGGSSSPAGSGAAANSVVLYTALFEVSNHEGDLRPDMTAQVFFVAAAARDAVTVPVAALNPADTAAERHRVTLIGDRGAIETREVRVGVRDRFNAQILDGLAEGERIVVGWKTDDGRPPKIGFRL
ncbi:efflux RND transporter periplasmic adaptor subunit (plasmid) [Azospirillum humicireducens]|uniref:Efflux RND transporter periplasmic adaptor subunit n=1 Tax=Azospirillum humicireducens TaxID=1226968 RepID=A0A2R4VRS6_9PROT|nr:efflux RND transporter periplasmic adaptor subunit [Azospirillum humicireducens]AWB07149.1 efflux RND transporter periplasmic adaptor subunit [Azospirillum humicireducens]